MPRRVQDIIPSNRRIIRDISVEKNGDKISKKGVTGEKAKENAESEPIKIHKNELPVGIRHMPITPPPPRHRTRRFPILATVAGCIILLAGFAFALSGHFARATFTIIPKSIPIQVNGTYVIPATMTGAMPLAYDIITITDTASTTVVATLGKNVEMRASGSVTLYNAYSSQSQRLVAGTRLANDSGLIYRLTSSVVIPGYTSTTGSVIPGSIAATMVADQSGASYNISRSDSLSDFKVVAYKGTPKYATFYARLSSDVSGGFSGVKSSVSSGTLASTSADLQTRLSASLIDKAFHSVPSGYIMYPKAYTQSFGVPSVVSRGTTTADVVVTSILYGIIFKRSDLAATLAGASSTDTFGSLAYDSPGVDSLSFSMINAKDFSPTKKNNLVVKISGSFKLIGSISVDTMKKAFAGVSLADTGTILNKYARVIDIPRSSGEISPPWVGTVPSDISRISIIVKNQ